MIKKLLLIILVIGLNGCNNPKEQFGVAKPHSIADADITSLDYSFGYMKGYAQGLKDCCNYPIRSPETHNPNCHKEKR